MRKVGESVISQPTPEDATRDLAADWETCERATAGPWYAHNTDDCMFMNVFCVTDCPREPDTELPEEEWSNQIIAMTLYQVPRVAEHYSRKWQENAVFMAAARTGWPAALRLLAEARREIERLKRELEKAYGPIDEPGPY